MSDKKVLLDAAALLVKLAGGPDTTTDPKLQQIINTWLKMVEQFDAESKPHEWRDFGNGVLPERAGDGTPESPFYEKFKSFWMAMERQGVFDHTKKPFNSLAIRKLYGWDGFETAIKFLAKTNEGKAWFNDPLNANYLPKAQDMLLLN